MSFKILALIAGLLVCIVPVAAMPTPLTINGDLSDWGITDQDLQNGLNNNDESAWVPTGASSNVIWVVENDVYANPLHPGYPDEYPNGYDYGVHIKSIRGAGNQLGGYSPYVEPTVNGYVQPCGGEIWDIEALYIDEDSNYVYVAIVTSIPPDGYSGCSATSPSHCPGDLAIDIDLNPATGGYGYDYGVRLGSYDNNQFKIYRTDDDNDWYVTQVLPGNKPATVDVANATYVGDAIGAYVYKGTWETRPSGGNTSVYVIELAIPKTAIGEDGRSLFGHAFRMHVAEAGCGNDAANNEIPEFPLILVPIGIIIGFLYYYNMRRT